MRISVIVRTAIAVLAVAAIAAGIFFARTPAGDLAAMQERQVAAREKLHELAKLVSRAQARSNAPLLRITGSACSDCVCRGRSLKGISDADACARAWANVLGRLEAAAGEAGTGSAFRRDVWGSPYALDENQGEVGNSSCSTPDKLRSLGQDATWGTPDDVVIDLPLARTCP